MQIDYLIIGQGISGTWLSYFFQKESKSFLVIDNNYKLAPSRIAAGIINPVTGRRHAEVWMANKILPFSLGAYLQIGNELGISAVSQKNIIDFFPSPQMRQSFMQRVEEKSDYVTSYPDQNHFLPQFNYDFGCGEIKPVYTVHLETLLPAWRKQLLANNQVLEEEFDITLLQVSTDKIQYKNITANKIIFCDGNSSASNPYFNLLPFAPNKGEMLLIEAPDLSPAHIYKKGMMLVPLSTPGEWWVGSNYAWEFDNENPTEEFRSKTEQLLKHWLKVPFTITDHLCGIRPATLERRPFVGFHPLHPSVGILNGMGTKGCSLSPFFAKQLANHLVHNEPINSEAAINRFSKILSRSIS
ncbi:FAD-dependent oxidoreductase [Chitinophagaceae bacterium IBVUCB2]|nr:FAD-dependent oxidoreductase [Chitinophagaceae bacterium IBVUCB2]